MGSTVPPAPSPSPAGSRSVGGGGVSGTPVPATWLRSPCRAAGLSWARAAPATLTPLPKLWLQHWDLLTHATWCPAPVHTAHRTCSSCPTGHHAPFQALSTASTPDHLVPLAGSVQERVGSDGPLDTPHRPLPSRASQHLPQCPGGSACGCCPCPRGHVAPALLATPSVWAAAPGRFLHHCPFPHW